MSEEERNENLTALTNLLAYVQTLGEDYLDSNLKELEGQIKLCIKLLEDYDNRDMISQYYIKNIVVFAQRILNLVTRDNLTGCGNSNAIKPYFDRQFHQIQNKSTEFMIVYFDLNNFKAINDKYGHEYGDNAITMFARMLLGAFHKDDLVVRKGGDEFLLIAHICPENPEQIPEVEQIIRNKVEAVCLEYAASIKQYFRNVKIEGFDCTLGDIPDEIDIFTASYGINIVHISNLEAAIMQFQGASNNAEQEMYKMKEAARYVCLKALAEHRDAGMQDDEPWMPLARALLGTREAVILKRKRNS